MDFINNGILNKLARLKRTTVECRWRFGLMIVLSFMLQHPLIFQNNVFKAGASLSNITPSLGTPIVGNFEPAAT